MTVQKFGLHHSILNVYRQLHVIIVTVIIIIIINIIIIIIIITAAAAASRHSYEFSNRILQCFNMLT